MTPQNLTPMETLLLDTLSASSAEHERRLSELETLLRQLAERSQQDSSSGLSAFESLKKQLDQVSTQLSTLDARLSKWEPYLNALSNRVVEMNKNSSEMTLAYRSAVDAFNSMKNEYLKLASEVTQLNDLAS